MEHPEDIPDSADDTKLCPTCQGDTFDDEGDCCPTCDGLGYVWATPMPISRARQAQINHNREMRDSAERTPYM